MAEVKVPEYSARLEERLKLEGPLTIDDIRAWLTEEGLEPGQVNLTTGYGYASGRKMYHKEGDTLVAGPRPGGGQPVAGRHHAVPELEDAQNQPTLKAQFQGLMESVAIEENQARAASNFCFGTFEMEDPAQIWQALRECLQIGQPGMKKQIWRLWTKHIHIDPPAALVQEVTNWGRNVPLPSAQMGRRVVVIDGEVINTTPDDPEGMTMADAARLVSIQRGKNDQTGGGMVATLLQQQGETDRKRLEIEAQRGRPEGESVAAAAINQLGEFVKTVANRPPDTSFETRIESQRREFEARMEAQTQRFLDLMTAQTAAATAAAAAAADRSQHQMEMIQTNNTHSLELLHLAMDGNNNQPSIMQQIEAVLTSGLIEKLKPAPAAPAMFYGADGKGMTLEVYKAIREMDLKSEALAFGKQAIPDVLSTAKDMVQATRELAASRGHTFDDVGEQPADDVVLMQTTCGHCGQVMSYPAGAAFLVCPFCRAPQTPDGRLMVPQTPPAQPDEPEPTEAVIQERPDRAPYEEAESPMGEEAEMSPLTFGSYFLEPPEGPVGVVSTPPPPAPEEPDLEPVPTVGD